MKKPRAGTYHPHTRLKAFGLLEFIVLVASVTSVLILLVFIFRPQKKVNIQCVSNVKMVATAFRMWANDHSGQFPWEVSTNEGGSEEFVGTGKVFMHFQSASNEFNTPKILVCPQDPSRSVVPIRDALNLPVFNYLSNANISYFVGINARKNEPARLLTGDRDISTNGSVRSGTLEIPAASDLKWAQAIHSRGGNLASSDGSAYQLEPNSSNVQRFTFPAFIEIP